MRRRWSPGRAAIAAAVVSLAALGWAVPANGAARANSGRTVTFAIRPGERPLCIFPLVSGADFTYANVTGFQSLIYRPRSWGGSGSRAVVNYRLSLADPPVFADRNRVVTITRRPSRWSDGVPVTARAVAFWMNLLEADKAGWGDYVPGQFPDNVAAVRVLSARSLRISFRQPANSTWLLYNELSQITPIPRHAWDRESAGGPVGTYDRTRAGAVRVYDFLNRESTTLSTYASDPLWRVVDGPWMLERGSGYDPLTGYTVLVPNPRDSGPVKPTIARLALVPYPSDTAEYTSLRAGSVDSGSLPLADVAQRGHLEAHGLRVVPWNVYAFSFIALNDHSVTAGPLLKQLYLRQALQRLIDQPSWVRAILRGHGSPSFSPIPITVPSPFADRSVRKNPHPFSIAAARRDLAAHGWRIVAGRANTCVRPGSGPRACGVGIRRGATLRLTLQYSAGDLPLELEMESFESDASRAGIDLALSSHPADDLLGIGYTPCTGHRGPACAGDLLDFHATDANAYFPVSYPTGGIYYATGAAYNAGGYRDPTADRLIRATHVQPGLGPFRAHENVNAAQLPDLWVPNGPIQVSVINDHLRGVVPQDPSTSMWPETWRWSG